MFRFLSILLILASLSASAQSISPFTINAGGAGKNTVDYSIGESSSIAFFQLENKSVLSSGFIQSYTPLVTGIVNRVFEEGEKFVLSPNPAADFIRLKGGLLKPGFVEFHLIDLQGRILDTYPATYYINYLEKEFKVAHLTGGTYFLRLIYSSPDGINQSTSFKFSRLN